MVDIKKLREDARVNRGIPDVFGKIYDRLSFSSLFTGPFAKKHTEILKSWELESGKESSEAGEVGQSMQQEQHGRISGARLWHHAASGQDLSHDGSP